MKWCAQCAKPNSIISGNVRDFKYTEKYVGRSDVDVVPWKITRNFSYKILNKNSYKMCYFFLNIPLAICELVAFFLSHFNICITLICRTLSVRAGLFFSFDSALLYCTLRFYRNLLRFFRLRSPCRQISFSFSVCFFFVQLLFRQYVKIHLHDHVNWTEANSHCI